MMIQSMNRIKNCIAENGNFMGWNTTTIIFTNGRFILYI